MAIFGKKKDKEAKEKEGSPAAAGPTSPPQQGRGSGAGAGSRETTPAGSSLNGHRTSNSLGQSSGIPPPGSFMGAQNNYGPPNGMNQGSPQLQQQSQMRQPGSTGSQPGAASTFKFGEQGQPQGQSPAQGGRPSMGPTGIPGPGSQRLRMVSSDNHVGGPQGPAGYAQQGAVPGGIMQRPPPQQQPQQQQPPPQQQYQQQMGGDGSGYPNSAVPPGESGQISGLPPSSSGPNTLAQGGPGGPGSSALGPPIQSPAARSQTFYPWSQRTCTMLPPRFLDETRTAPPGTLSPSPFPRYGHAANTTASSNGDVYLFGGLVRESVKNDLYTVNVSAVTQPPTKGAPGSAPGAVSLGGVTAMLVQTTGEIPPPRVGHATILVSNVLILWGGDTKVRADDKQDEYLYLLNLGSREWTRVKSEAPNSGPTGRYGHTVSIVGSRFYVFGGQVDGSFMNDLWAFDLNSLKSTPTWELVKPSSDAPPRRTGHASVTYKDKIYVFGGTDGQYHYNDTWCYDVATNSWQELNCIGYIPVPREGHATCLVDDVMYIFGGRGVDGRDLGDLASFRLSNNRWFMFANMGPAPSGRSGHVLTAHQDKVVVLGGESFTGGKPDDPSVSYVLDTGKIKYPDTRAGRKMSLQGASGAQPGPASPQSTTVSRSVTPSTVNPKQSTGDLSQRAVSPTQRGASGAPPAGLIGVMQQADANGTKSPTPAQPNRTAQTDPSLRAISPSQNYPRDPKSSVLAQMNQQGQPSTMVQNNAAARSVSSPTYQQPSAPAPFANGLRQQKSNENVRSASSGPVMGAAAAAGAVGLGAGALASQNSQSQGQQSKAVNGPQDVGVAPPSQLQEASRYAATPAVQQPLSQPNGIANANASANANTQRLETEQLRRREAWLQSALLLAYKKGFVAPDELEMPDGSSASARDSALNLDSVDTGKEGSDKDRIVRSLVSLKTQLSAAKATIAHQSQQEADRVAEVDRGRLAALQEAAFFRAKLYALEKGDLGEVNRLDRERAAQGEKQLAEALRESEQLERQIKSLREDLKLEQSLRSSAEERLSETAKRAMAAEGAQMRAYDELAMLQKRSYGHESQLRDYQDQVTQLNSLVSQHRSDHESSRDQLDKANDEVKRHRSALPELQAAVAAAAAKADEHERLYLQHRDAADQHASTINELQAELDSRSREVDNHSSRIQELESLLETHKSEAEAHRSALNGNMSQLILLQQQQAASRGMGDDTVPEHITEKMAALETEAESLRQLNGQSRSAADAASGAVQDLRDRNFTLEKQHSGLRTELSAMRSQLAIALQEVTRMKDQGSSKDIELRERSRALETAQLRDNLLRQYISDQGIEVPGDDALSSSKGGRGDKRTRDLEIQLDTRTREVQEAEERLREATSRIESLQQDVAAGGATSRGLSGSDAEDLERRVELAERELAEATANYKERSAQLESDYQTAVSFVKGTEKMLRRMKDELTKYKAENATLRSDLAAARAGSPTGASEAAKDIAALRSRLADITGQAEEAAAENRELQKRLAATIADQKDFHDRSRQREDNQVDHSRRAVELEREASRLRNEVQEMLQLNQHLNSELRASAASAPATGHLDSTNTNNQNEHLRTENETLARRLQETEDKLGLLIGQMESNIGDNDSVAPSMDDDRHLPGSIGYAGSAGRGSGGSGLGGRLSISSELDKWERERGIGMSAGSGTGPGGSAGGGLASKNFQAPHMLDTPKELRMSDPASVMSQYSRD